MQNFKSLLIISSILVLVSCSKDGYGPNEVNLGSSNSYNPQSSDYGNTSSSTTAVSQ